MKPHDLEVRPIGDRAYALDALPDVVRLEVHRVRRDRNELVGELSVTCRLPGAHWLTASGLIHLADFNLSSAVARTTRAKMLRERSEAELDWSTWLEKLCVETLEHERRGPQARWLHDYPPADLDEPDIADVSGWPLSLKHATILFGDGGSLKSYLALYAAGVLAQQGYRVLFCDWELDGEDHRERLVAMFGAPLPAIRYRRCERPLLQEADGIRRLVGQEDITYGFFDSVGMGTPGPPEASEHALGYFQALREIGLRGQCLLAHTSRTTDPTTGEEPKPGSLRNLKPFGSVFWHNSARNTWFIRRAEDAPTPAQLRLGLYHQKTFRGPLQAAVGLSVRFRLGQTTIAPADLTGTAEWAANASVRQRMVAVLQTETKMVMVELAEAAQVALPTAKTILYRHRDTFIQLINEPDGIHRWGLAPKKEDESHVH